MKNFVYTLFLVLTAGIGLSAQTTVTITDGDLEGGMTYNWTNDKVYMLDGFVFLEAGGVLNIEAGTVIKGIEQPSTSDNASALIISRGAQIYANGTANAPVIFTAEVDDVNDAFDLDGRDRGLWGGLIVLGHGVLGDNTSEVGVEGIPAGESRALYGGNNDEDNSGSLTYVSIRHGGAELSPGDEINGLTLGGVGSQTVMDHIEVIANSDDGIEFFGGKPNLRYAVVAFCGDDSFDWDTGFQGKGQFWFAYQGTDEGDHGAEMDGAKPDDNARFAAPTIYNATYIGAGIGAAAKNEHALLFRDGTGGHYNNSIFTSFAGKAIQVEDLASGVDSRQRLADGDLSLNNNIWWEFGAGSTLNDIINPTETGGDISWLIAALTAGGNTLEDPQLGGISRQTDGGLDPRPSFNGPAYDNLASYDDPWFKEVDFKGAFGATNWLRGWTAVESYGYLPAQQECVITDDDLMGGQTYNWTNDCIYLLDGFVFLEDGGRLNIAAGTVIKGKETPSTTDNASALIIARGAQIYAEGTADNPIIFTAEVDDTDDAFDMFPEDRGLWGGLIVLGNGILGDNTSEVGVEGIPAGETRALYGGNNDADNSGVLRYVSIRHGGAELSPGDEINGLTLGGVGSGTTMEYIEVFANSDDGIEFFGGQPHLKWASVAFCGDDSYDWDTGFRGKGQFWFALIGSDDGDNGAEMDGAKPDDNARFSQPNIYNATYIGSGIGAAAKNEHALLFRDGTGGYYHNSIFTSFVGKALQVEDLSSGLDSRQRLENGELALKNNIWWEFGAGADLTDIINPTTAGGDVTWLINHLGTNGNTLEDPQLGGISRDTDEGLDPRPNFDGPAFGSLSSYDDPWHTPVYYKGAFCSQGVWIKGWTALSEYGILNSAVPASPGACQTTSTDDFFKENNGFVLAQNTPNPVFNETTISFSTPRAADVSLVITNAYGKVVKQVLNDARLMEGDYNEVISTADMPAGVYFYSLRADKVVLTKSFMIQK